ncbi:nuclear transport factor 2 family protein [Micromonospora sp. LOL_023]|uniref:nuclear transport factor 2 family protein n=1 Tax=Micromonospora sp. LOL_023 TaxID=3345418 RepID=UPI003A8C04F6
MTHYVRPAETPVAATDYVEVQHFYARHMAMLDAGEAGRWAGTFSEDAIFEEPGRLQPLQGRDAIFASAQARADRVSAEGVQFRHWVGMISVTAGPAGALHAHYYALVLAVPRGGPVEVRASVDCRDVLVRQNDELLVRHRLLSVDGS